MTTEFQKVAEISSSECREALKNKYIRYFARGEWLKLNGTLGMTRSYNFFTNGGVDKYGYCVWATFKSGGLSFEKSYEETFVDLSFEKFRGTYDVSNGKVKFSNGLIGHYFDETLIDAEYGRLIWTAKKANCLETVSEIYNGNATVYKKKTDSHRFAKGSVLMVKNEESLQYIGLKLVKEQDLCGVNCFNSQVPGIVVCFRDFGQIISKLSGKSMANVDPKYNDLKASMAFLSLKNSFAIAKNFREIQTQICNLERQSLHNKLQALADKNPYALLDIYGKGYKVLEGGAVAYLLKCTRKEATLAVYPNCTKEIPIRLIGENVTKFADPLTFNIKDFPSIIHCNPVMPMRFKIGTR